MSIQSNILTTNIKSSIKYKPNYLIIPSHPFISSVFVHAAIWYIIDKIEIKRRQRR